MTGLLHKLLRWEHPLKVSYDADADAAYLDFGAARRVSHTVEAKIAPHGVFGQINVDVDAEGRVVGLEILGASTILPRSLLKPTAPTRSRKDRHA